MKKTAIALLLAITSGITAFAQKPITIRGTITNAPDPKLIVADANISIPDGKQETLALPADGRFSVTLPVKQKYNWVVLQCGSQHLDVFIKEGSTLTFTASGKSFDSTARFEGKDANIPGYFTDWARRNGGVMAHYNKLQQLAARESNAYMPALDSVQHDEGKALRSALDQKRIPKDYYDYLSHFLQYSGYIAMLRYPVVHEMFKQQSNNINVQNIPQEQYAVARKVPQLFKDEYQDVAFYQLYAQSYHATMLTAAGYMNMVNTDPQTGKTDLSQAFRQTDSVLQLLYKTVPRKTGEFAAGRILIGETKGWPPDSLEKRVKLYQQQYPKSANNTVLNKMLADLKKFNAGQPALDFTFKTLEGKEMKLSDLRGKVVYMDFWASWCGPCKGEMPYAKKIKEHFLGKDVVFLYVSIDDKEEAWKKGIEAMSISGIHTRTAGWGGDVAQLYEIKSVPSYFLIDKQGRYVTEKTPRPSQSDALIKLIEGLL